MLAIVIPYFKLTFFEETLQSLANQTDQRFKVYIGNDASPDDPSALLDKYQGGFDFVYHEFKENLGGISLTKQWERCIELSIDEEWIMILGDDDTLSYNCVEFFYLYLAEIEEHQINVIRYATVVIDQNNKELSIVHTHPKYEKSIDFLMRKFKGGTRSSLSEFIFKKKVLQEIRFKNLPLAWYSDLLAVLEVSFFSTLFTINESVVSFRLSGINITSKNDNLILKNRATYKFYYYLLNVKSNFFNLEERRILMDKLEKTFLDNKKNIFFWYKLIKLHIKNKQLDRLLLFSNLYIKSIYKYKNPK